MPYRKLWVLCCLCALVLSGLGCKLSAVPTVSPTIASARTPAPKTPTPSPSTTALLPTATVRQPSPTAQPSPTPLPPSPTKLPTTTQTLQPTSTEPIPIETLAPVEAILPPPFPGHVLSADSSQPMCDDQMLQFRLASLGYLQPGSEEWQAGTFGPETEAAVLAFEQANGLVEDGRVDWQEWGSLFAPSAVPAGGGPVPTLQPVQSSPVFSVGGSPVALAFDGQQVWVALASDTGPWGSTLLAIDPLTGQISAPILVGECPPAYESGENTIDDLIYAAGKLWVVMPGSSSYQAIDPLTGLSERPVRYASYPTVDCALGFDGQRLWVSSLADIALRAFDPQTGELIYELSLYGGPGAMLMLDQELWVVNGASVSEVVDPQRGEIVREVMAGGLSIAFDGSWLWFADGSWVIAIDPAVEDPFASDSTYMLIVAGSSPVALAFDGSRMWVADVVDNTLQPIDTATGEPGLPIPVGNSPSALLFDGARLWVANHGDGTVQFIIP
jgi:hypothetical protein